jgi:hypothetical protein
MTRVVALLCATAMLLLAPAAQAAEPLVLAASTPANNAFVPPTAVGGIPWQVAVTGPPPGANVAVTVSTIPALDADGVMPIESRIDFFFLSESPVPGTYTGRSDPGPNAWSEIIATFFWQATATWTDAAGVFHSAAGPVQRLNVGTPPPPSATPRPGAAGAPSRSPSSARTTIAMNELDALYYVRLLIRRHTGRVPVGLHYGCAPLTSRSFRCRPRWRDSRNVYSGTATFTHTRRGSRIAVSGTLRGRRASRRCTRTRTVRSCGRAFRWRAPSAPRLPGT